MKYFFRFFIKLVVIYLCACASLVEAYSTFYCEKEYRNVSVGDSMDTVRAACGDPTHTTTKEQQVLVPVDVDQWVYNLGLLPGNGSAVITLPSLTLTFRDNAVIQIDRVGFPNSNVGQCNVIGVVHIGDSKQKTLSVCGQPDQVNHSQLSTKNTKVIVVWTYDYGSYRPQIIFDFDETGRLTEISSGPLGGTNK